MKQINLLPEPTLIQKYRLIWGVGTVLALASTSMYWLWPYFSRAWHVYSYPFSTLSRHSAIKTEFVQHSIYKLKIVGYLSKGMRSSGEQPWSVMQAPDGQVSIIKIGDYLGYESAQVTDINPIGIYLRVSHQTEPVLVRATISKHQ